MGLTGTIDSSVYQGLKDVLQRHPVIERTAYEPNSIVKKFLRAEVDPARISPPTGPTQPTLDVEWRFTSDDQQYRIHYADPNTGFNCGWHRDEDHPELGAVHFQYERPEDAEPTYRSAGFENELATEILWSALDQLFGEKVPALTKQ